MPERVLQSTEIRRVKNGYVVNARYVMPTPPARLDEPATPMMALYEEFVFAQGHEMTAFITNLWSSQQ